MIKINNICKSFNNIQVLDNIDLDIHQTITGLAGPSGCGKSTLLRCIQKLETLDSGYIEYSGNAGFMFQDFQLFPHMTILENLTYAPKLNSSIQNLIKIAFELLESLDIYNKANHYSHNLSGGEKQRAALARSLIMKPKILLCDEPTSGLDVATITDVIGLLKSISDTGITMIIASHDLDFLTKISRRIILLKNGKVSLDINPKNFDNPINYLKNHY